MLELYFQTWVAYNQGLLTSGLSECKEEVLKPIFHFLKKQHLNEPV